MATRKARKTAKKVQKVVTENNLNYTGAIKNTAKDLNKFMLETTEVVLDGAIVAGGKWQDVSAKAIQGGLKLAAGNQDLVFDTLETFKGQLMDGAGRLKTMFSKN